mgnify:FL=1
MTGCEWFAFGGSKDIDVNLAILEVSRSVAFISFGGLDEVRQLSEKKK